MPRSVLRKRAAAPFTLISRAMAAYRVADGVLPAGLVQYPLAAIAAINAPQDIAWPLSASTRAAASSAVRRLPSLTGPFLVLAARLNVFFLAMMHLLGGFSHKRHTRVSP